MDTRAAENALKVSRGEHSHLVSIVVQWEQLDRFWLLLALRPMPASGPVWLQLQTSEPGRTALHPFPDVCDGSG